MSVIHLSLRPCASLALNQAKLNKTDTFSHDLSNTWINWTKYTQTCVKCSTFVWFLSVLATFNQIGYHCGTFWYSCLIIQMEAHVWRYPPPPCRPARVIMTFTKSSIDFISGACYFASWYWWVRYTSNVFLICMT